MGVMFGYNFRQASTVQRAIEFLHLSLYSSDVVFSDLIELQRFQEDLQLSFWDLGKILSN